MELIFNPCGEFRCEVWRAQLAKSTLLACTLVPLGPFMVCSDATEWGAESNGKQPVKVPGKTASSVPEFAVEGLPSAEAQPRFLRLQ